MADYLTAAEFLLYYDERRVRQLCTDSTVPVTGDLSNNPILLTCFRSASAELDSAIQVSRRYDREAIEQLCADSRAVSAPAEVRKRAEAVKEIVADLAWGRLISRRGHSADEMGRLAPRYALAQERIARLVNGDAIFDFDAPKDAGVPSSVGIAEDRVPLSRLPLFAYYPPGGWPGVVYSPWDRR